MENDRLKSIKELLAAYNNGQRYFENWDFPEEDSAQGLDLSGIEFRYCFLFLDFKDCNLTGAKLIDCNIKTADFRGANLKNALIKNCSVEATLFKGAKVENFRFEENYCYSITTGPNDFEKLFKNSDER